MTITLTLEKKEKILNLCHNIFKEDVVTVRFPSEFIGNLVAAFPAVALSLFYYRALEMDKAKALRLSHGNYDTSIRLSNEVKKRTFLVDN